MGKQVLVILQDDYEESQLVRRLREVDYNAKSTFDDPPDLVVMDSAFRGGKAMHYLTEMIKKFQVSTIPVLLLGGSPIGPIEGLLKKFGSSKNLRRPCEPKEVIEAVQALMRRLNKGDD